jgi:hypothetical protein
MGSVLLSNCYCAHLPYLYDAVATEGVFIYFRFICFVTVVKDVYFTSITMGVWYYMQV